VEELLEMRLEDGVLTKETVLPALLVSARPRYVDSEGWFGARAIEVVQKAFGTQGMRLCEACMAPRAYVEDGAMAYQTGPVGLDEIVRLDDQLRGNAQAARSAIWIDENVGGVSIRIVDLRTGGVLFAQNVDPLLVESANSKRSFRLSEELERRARRDSLTQAFVDIGIYPGQHVSFDWTDQWGAKNRNLTGFTISLFDPVVGLGANYYYATPLFNTLVGGKIMVSLPTALVRAVGNNNGVDVVDPLLNLVGVVRVPIGRSNYGVLATASSNGQITLGISLMNISVVPVIP